MEIVLEVPDKDVTRVLELVKGIKRVKIKSPKPTKTAAKERFLTELSEAVQQVNKITRGEVNKITRGEAKGRPWKELYQEAKAEEAAEAKQL